MRAALLVLALLLAAPASALAAPGDAPSTVMAPAAAAPGPGGAVDPAGSTMRQPEQLGQKPSGFWMSSRPARGGAYRYRILAIGAGVLVVSAWLVLRLIRRTDGQRARAGGAGGAQGGAASSPAR